MAVAVGDGGGGMVKKIITLLIYHVTDLLVKKKNLTNLSVIKLIF